MKFLVTGCTGFIGTHLTRALLAEGHEVIGLVRDPKKLDPDLAPHVTPLLGDLAIFRRQDLVLPEADVVIHLAAVIAGKSEAEYGAINLDAVRDLLDAIARQSWRPRRLVFASSLAAAGPSREGHPHTEEDDTAPIDAYGRAKRSAEDLVRAQPFPTTSFRPPLVLGAGDPASLTLYKMARGRVAFLPAGPPQALSFVSVDDLVQAILAMARDASSEHRLYYASNETPTTNRDMIGAMARAVDPARVRGPLVVPLPYVLLYVAMLVATFLSKIFRFTNQLDRKQLAQMTAPSFVCTSARLTRDTGWVAEATLDDTTRKAVAGYRARGQL